jgi:Ulp1 family protease
VVVVGQVINAWFALLAKRAEVLETSCYFSSTFMLTQLLPLSQLLPGSSEYCYANVRRWTRDVDLFAKRKIFIPVHVGDNHWVNYSFSMQVALFAHRLVLLSLGAGGCIQ